MINQTQLLFSEINPGQNGQPIFELNKKYTIFRFNSLAMTCKQQIGVVSFDAEGNPIYKNPGKRKLYVLKLKTKDYTSAPEKMFDGAVFEGLEQPYTCDTDGGRVFRGNALYNFVGDVEGIKKWIQEKQLNPWFEISSVVAIPDKNQSGGEIPVFPEYFDGNHAVMARILAKGQN